MVYNRVKEGLGWSCVEKEQYEQHKKIRYMSAQVNGRPPGQGGGFPPVPPGCNWWCIQRCHNWRLSGWIRHAKRFLTRCLAREKSGVMWMRTCGQIETQ